MEEVYRKALEAYLDCNECKSRGYLIKRLMMKHAGRCDTEEIAIYPCPRCNIARKALGVAYEQR